MWPALTLRNPSPRRTPTRDASAGLGQPFGCESNAYNLCLFLAPGSGPHHHPASQGGRHRAFPAVNA
jgi:hypothetical protein